MLNESCKETLISCQGAIESLNIEMRILESQDIPKRDFTNAMFTSSDTALENHHVRTKHCAYYLFYDFEFF